ncbi:MAG: endonuclease III [Oscillospiraceae bacterium]|nr:endonuclease III [Oscillospiraceae bacterium]MBR2637022.1 endonuclease III [Oscillospiraceae bacterium]
MTKKQTAEEAVRRLEVAYPDAICSLESSQPHELLIATRLSAQCTDARVNIVTRVLFEKYKTVHDFAAAELSDVEEIVRTCGLYKTKARDIIAMCKILESEYDSTVPDEMDELLKLPGVGRKTANLVLGDVYGKPAVVCDTHCIRITNHIGLTDTKDPLKCEMQLRKVLPAEKSNDFCHRLVLHGRAVCKARNPLCGECTLKDICKTGKKAK